jgi:hypothetical protein
MTLARPATLFFSFCLLLAGCTPAVRWAERSYDRLLPGMSTEEVREEIGPPTQIVRGDQGQPETWRYEFKAHPSTGGWIVIFLVIVPLVVAIVLVGGGTSFNFEGGSAEPLAEFLVEFDGQGRIVGVSPIRLIPR